MDDDAVVRSHRDPTAPLEEGHGLVHPHPREAPTRAARSLCISGMGMSEGCGLTAPALKTVRWRRGAERRKFVLCDECYAPLSASLWIVRGHHDVFGKCEGCGSWFSLRDFALIRPGRKKSDFGGVCRNCAEQG